MYEAHGHTATDAGWHSLTASAAMLDVPALQRQVERLWLTHPLVGQIVGILCDFSIGAGLTVTSPDSNVQQAIDAFIASQSDWEALQRGVATHLSVYGEAIVHLEQRSGESHPRCVLLPPTEVVRVLFDNEGQLAGLVHERVIGGRVQRRELLASDVVYVRSQAGLPLSRGLPEFARILPWVSKYDQWLEDRVRINKTSGAFAFLRKVPGWGIAPDGSLSHGSAEATIPRPGSVLVVNEQESWDVLSPQIGADDAAADGRSLKLMILAGAGVAEHYVGDLAQSNLATATAAELPMLKRFEAHQRRVIGVFRQIFERIVPGINGLELTLPSPGLRDAAILTATLAQQLELGLISRRTAQSLIPWIPDVGSEAARIAQERSERTLHSDTHIADQSSE